MTAFVDLDSIHTPSSGVAIPASWGLQVNANMDHFNELELLTCTSGTRPGSPVTNKLIYETDTLRILHWNGSAWKIVADFGPRRTYTPTWVQLGTIAKTTVRSEYRYVGREVSGVVFLTATNGGSSGNIMTVTTPVTAAWASNQAVGAGTYTNGSANFPLVVWLNSTGTFSFIPAWTASTNYFGTQTLFYTSGAAANTSFAPTVGIGHSILFHYQYEAASAA